MNQVDTIHKGLGSISAMELANEMPDFQYSEIVKILVQVVIGVITIMNLLRKPKKLQ